jgi:hypothetical protein
MLPVSTVTHDPQPDWNQGWQDFVIGLALSFAFVEGITAVILLEHRPVPAAAAAATSVLTLVAKILSLALPPALGYGTYAALATWTYRAQARMQASGRTGGFVHGRPIRSPYRLGSVLIFWATILGLFATTLFGTGDSARSVVITATVLRLIVGVACAWLAVFVRKDIDALLAPDNNAGVVDAPVS